MRERGREREGGREREREGERERGREGKREGERERGMMMMMVLVKSLGCRV